MSLDATFFATGFAAIRCQFDDSAATTGTSTADGYITYSRGPVGWLVFLWNSNRETNDEGTTVVLNEKDPEFGYVYALRNSDGHELGLSYMHATPIGPTWTGRDGGRGYFPFSKRFRTGAAAYQVATLRVTIPTGGATAYSVWAYMPSCWYGLASRVTAAILRARGLPADYIDTAAWSAADDGQIAMDANEYGQPCVFYRRELGQTIAEAVKTLVRQTWDLLAVNLSGKIGLYSRSAPAAAHTTAGLTLDDGVTLCSWRVAYEHMANRCVCSHGRWYLANGSYIPGTSTWVPIPVSEVAVPSSLGSDVDTWPLATYEDTTAQTRFGVIELSDSQVSIMQDKAKVNQRVFTLPYLCCLSEVNYPFGTHGERAKDNIMARLSTHESQPRREVEISQDLRGLDYDTGHYITGVAVTPDGDTFDAFCIAKTIDFRSMRITSTLLEEL